MSVNYRNRSVNAHDFAMIPRAEIPRSSFKMEKGYKTTFDSGYLIPFHCQEVLPGDSFSVRAAVFARMSTPLYPIMDNLHLDTFWFFVPNRLVWNNWQKFQGEQDNPGDSISYTVPQQVTPAGGYALNSLQDYFGLPTVGQVAGGNTVSHSGLPLRGYILYGINGFGMKLFKTRLRWIRETALIQSQIMFYCVAGSVTIISRLVCPGLKRVRQRYRCRSGVRRRSSRRRI